MRLRTAVEDMRSNEIRLKQMCKQYELKLTKERERYVTLSKNSKRELQR